MLYVPNDKERDPRINLAIETYLLQNMPLDEPILLFILMSRPLLSVVIKIRLKRSTKNTWMKKGFMLFVG